MADAPRFVRDPHSTSSLRATALAEADEMLHASLIAARRDAGLSQQDVADAMGVTQPTVAAFERYDNDPRMSTIRRYAHAVGIVVTHTVTRDGSEVPCGWTAASTAGFTFSVTRGESAGQVRMSAPEMALTDLALAA